MRKELVLDRHPNHVRLFYSKDDQGLARVTPKQLLECCLRMKPDRILLAELRAEEAFDYLRNVNSRPPGLDHQRARGELPSSPSSSWCCSSSRAAAARSSRARDIKNLLICWSTSSSSSASSATSASSRKSGMTPAASAAAWRLAG